MKKLLLIAMLCGLNLFAQVGDNGSEVVSDEIKLKVELIKADDSSVTVLDGTQYLSIKGNGTTTSIGNALNGVKPADGNYTAIQWRGLSHKVKAKIVKGSTTYYTKNITVPEDDTTPFALTTEESQYAPTIITDGSVTKTFRVKFPQPLEVSSTSTVNLYYVNKLTSDVVYFGNGTDTNVSAATWVSNSMEAFGFLPGKPAKMAQFDIVDTNSSSTVFKNKITLFFDANDKLLGAHSSEGVGEFDGFMHGGFVTESSKSTNAYTLKVYADSVNTTHTVTFNLTCSGTTASYSNLAVNPSPTDGGRTGTLTTSGSGACTNLTIAE